MKQWINIFKVFILITGLVAMIFEAQLYILFKHQKNELESVKSKLDVESEFNSNKFKYQADQIERLSKDLEDSLQMIRDQKDALADQKDALVQEAEKRQQVENASRDVQTSLVDIKAEADAIKQEMKGWQKDYVGVLADLEKKMDSSQEETKALETNLTALDIPDLKENINSLKADIEKMNHPTDNIISDAVPAPEKTAVHDEVTSPQ